MKLSTIFYAAGAFAKTFGLAGMGISLVTSNIYVAGGFALLAAAGQALDSSADVLKRSGNGNAQV